MQSQASLYLTLYCLPKDMHCDTIAELMVGRSGWDLPANWIEGILDGCVPLVHPRLQALSDIEDLGDIRILCWDCDWVYSRLSDFSASILDSATWQTPIGTVLAYNGHLCLGYSQSFLCRTHSHFMISGIHLCCLHRL